jgi:hypothetical protein
VKFFKNLSKDIVFQLLKELIFFHTSYEMLQDNVEGYRREITSLQERNQKLTATTQKQEQIINTMTQDLRGANEKLAVAEVRLVHLSGLDYKLPLIFLYSVALILLTEMT